MRLRLQYVPTKERKQKRIRPVNHFSKCPKCGDAELIRLDPDVLCSKCDWDSCLWDVQRGGMNNLEAAAREFFQPKMNVIDGQGAAATPANSESESNNEKKGA